MLIAKLDAETTDMLDALMAPLDGGRPHMIVGTLTLIEWEGELAPGKIPAGARRLGAVARPGQQVTVRQGWFGEELKRGMEMELEPNLGANNRIVDMRLYVKIAGKRSVEVSTGLTLVAGKPVVVPVGAEGGRKLGWVLECRVLDAAGRARGD